MVEEGGKDIYSVTLHLRFSVQTVLLLFYFVCINEKIIFCLLLAAHVCLL
jgi:hypothetical protein